MELTYLYVKSGRDFVQLNFLDILFIEAKGRYIVLKTCLSSYTLQHTLTHIEAKLPRAHFSRIHKSFIVGLRHVKSYNSEIARVANMEIPIGRKYKTTLPERAIILADVKPGRMGVKG